VEARREEEGFGGHGQGEERGVLLLGIKSTCQERASVLCQRGRNNLVEAGGRSCLGETQEACPDEAGASSPHARPANDGLCLSREALCRSERVPHASQALE
jgi:hypothetical protein